MISKRAASAALFLCIDLALALITGWFAGVGLMGIFLLPLFQRAAALDSLGASRVGIRKA